MKQEYTEVKDKKKKKIYVNDVVIRDKKYYGVKFGKTIADGLDYFSDPFYGYYLQNLDDELDTVILNDNDCLKVGTIQA